MPYYLLLSRSITHAQRMNAVLERIGIHNSVFRPPVGLTEKGCSYALRVAAPHFPTAMEHLQALQLMPVRVFYAAGDGAFREIMPRR